MEVKNVSETEKVKIYCYTSPSGKKYIGFMQIRRQKHEYCKYKSF